MGKLQEYNQKRDFGQTQEPQGKVPKKAGKKLTFVVQRHHASRLHYDLRLELGGVMKSWAVPKGPSLNPKDKRLAVQVEDHPISYSTFEGEIPKGNYGAGVVTIFDEGYYTFVGDTTPAGFQKELENGSIKFELQGKILKGEFALVRIKGEDDKNWLLIKHRDRFSKDDPFDSEDLVSDRIKKAGEAFKGKRPAKATASKGNQGSLADFVPKPMLATLTDTLPKDKNWLYEKKYDGFRILARKAGEEVTLFSRNGNNLNKLYPSLVGELQSMEQHMCLDGELVIEDKNGKSHFQLLKSGEPIPKTLYLRYYVFDVLWIDDVDLTGYTLQERQELLGLLLKKMKGKRIIRKVQMLTARGGDLMEKAENEQWEGIIAKTADSTYLTGKRSSFWVKAKLRHSQEAIICGYTKPQNSRPYFGALVLGVQKDGDLQYIGNCGTGYDDKTLKAIHEQLQQQKTTEKPFDKATKVAKEKDVSWVKPVLVCEVYYSEWTRDGHLRHPVFKSLRTDKENDEVEIEQPMKKEIDNQEVTVGRKKVQLTSLNKIYWPKEKYVKGQMLAYYDEMAPLILPYVKDKPLSMHRFPNGIEADGFFQKDVDPENMPDWIKTQQIYSESTDKMVDYLICNDKATLLYVANLGSIEINPWLSTYKKQDHPEFAVLDLDPNGADFREVVAVALTARDLLTQIGVKAFVKTSGSTGLHVYMYTKKKYTYDVVRDFIQWLAQTLQEMFPDTTSVVRDPKKRKGLIYLDFLQNRRGQTIVSPYSLRPKPGATASAPLSWDELDDKIQIADFNIRTMLQRVEKIKDPWAEIWDGPTDIKAAISKI